VTNILGHLAGALLGAGFFLIGFVNLFWGNDPFFGLGIVVFSFFFFLPSVEAIKQAVDPKYWRIGLGILALMVLWASLGVGELGDKMELMKGSFPLPNITGI